jgi:hypothetical protein
MPDTAVDPQPWDGDRLHLVLGYAYDAFGKKGRADANQIARELHVTPSTVRRWLRHSLPARRREFIAEKILPGHSALDQERRELDYALDALSDIYSGDKTRLLPIWKENEWLQPHILAVVHLERRRVCVPRIARADGDPKKRARLREWSLTKTSSLTGLRPRWRRAKCWRRPVPGVW